MRPAVPAAEPAPVEKAPQPAVVAAEPAPVEKAPQPAVVAAEPAPVEKAPQPAVVAAEPAPVEWVTRSVGPALAEEPMQPVVAPAELAQPAEALRSAVPVADPGLLVPPTDRGRQRPRQLPATQLAPYLLYRGREQPRIWARLWRMAARRQLKILAFLREIFAEMVTPMLAPTPRAAAWLESAG